MSTFSFQFALKKRGIHECVVKNINEKCEQESNENKMWTES